jgi:hypothetical protein
MDGNTEEWREIEGYNGSYQVSNTGLIRSFKVSKLGRLLKHSIDGDGYIYVHLSNSRYETRTMRVHRLVAIAFIKNPNELTDVNHKNGIKTDNHADNLEWCSHQQNLIHYFAVLKNWDANNNKSNKLSKDEVLSIFKLANDDPSQINTIAKMFDVSSSLVYKIKNGKKWSWLTNKQFVKNTHTRSKLTEDDAKSIFYHAWAGKLTHVEIGAMFNISKS